MVDEAELSFLMYVCMLQHYTSSLVAVRVKKRALNPEIQKMAQSLRKTWPLRRNEAGFGPEELLLLLLAVLDIVCTNLIKAATATVTG